MRKKRKTSADRANPIPSRHEDASTAKLMQSFRMIGEALFPARVMLFVVFFAWYLYAVVDLRLVYLISDMLFLWNFHFFTDFLGEPGSLMRWTDSLLVQLCYWGWPGAIVIAAFAWLLLVSTIGFMNVLGHSRIGGTWVIPSIFFTALYSGYLFPKSMIVGLALAMLAVNGWCRLRIRRDWLRWAVFSVLSAVLYYVVGEAYYCFAACCAIHEAMAEKRRLSGLLLLLAAVGVKLSLDAILMRINPASNYFHVATLEKYHQREWNWPVVLFYSYFPTCALFAVFRQAIYASAEKIWRLCKPKRKKSSSERGKTGKQPTAVSLGHGIASAGWLRWAAGTVLLLSPAATAGYFFLDRESRAILEIDYCAEHRLWNELLANARNVPINAYSRTVNHDVNLALYHTGSLPYQMFSYPQLYPPLLGMQEISHYVWLRKPIDLLYEMGRIGHAERLALEMQEMWPCGRSLKCLAQVKMVKGQTAAARLFLDVLRDDLIWGRWAEEYLRRLASDPELAKDEEIQRIRGLMILQDDTHLTQKYLPGNKLFVDYGAMLQNLLKHNPKNRMAFEYLMGICLQQRKAPEAVDFSSYMNGFSYTEIPPLYEEAAIICLSEFPKHQTNAKKTDSGVFLCGRNISGVTMNKLRRLQSIAAPCGGLNEKAKPAVSRELGNSYFYYFYYPTGKGK